MRVARHRQFRHHFKKRIAPNPKLIKQFEARLKLFLKDRKNPVLKDHRLVGKQKNFRAFSITGDVRVIYRVQGRVVRFYDVGTHNQVY